MPRRPSTSSRTGRPARPGKGTSPRGSRPSSSRSDAPEVVPQTLFVSTIPGATPSKWVERFTSRERRVQLVNHDDGAQLLPLASGEEGVGSHGLPMVGYLRWPLSITAQEHLRAGGIDPETVHVVQFYRESPVVCVGREHLLAAWDPDTDGPVPVEELDPEERMDPARFAPPVPADPLDAPETPGSGERMALEIVASGVGHTVLPASVARQFGRKDVVVLPLQQADPDAEGSGAVQGHPGWQVGLAWLREHDSPLVQDFIGAAKGRRPGSSRG